MKNILNLKISNVILFLQNSSFFFVGDAQSSWEGVKTIFGVANSLGVDQNTFRAFVNKKDSDGRTALDLATAESKPFLMKTLEYLLSCKEVTE